MWCLGRRIVDGLLHTRGVWVVGLMCISLVVHGHDGRCHGHEVWIRRIVSVDALMLLVEEVLLLWHEALWLWVALLLGRQVREQVAALDAWAWMRGLCPSRLFSSHWCAHRWLLELGLLIL